MNLYVVFILALTFTVQDTSRPDWGFFGHKLINYLAVFSLPPGLIEFYKPQAYWLRDHAVDPDKRRYALPGEGVRHYIDLDHWHFPRNNMPPTWREAVLLTGRYSTIENGDTIEVILIKNWCYDSDLLEVMIIPDSIILHCSLQNVVEVVSPHISVLYAPETHHLTDSIWSALGWDSLLNRSIGDIYLEDRFSEHGVLPYYLQAAIERLTRAFYIRDTRSIFRLAADIGHYTADAHVPLHTTKNYNGQLTGQLGIHAFWESRIPELLAESDFDLWAGKASYIEDIDSFVWKIIMDSHAGVSMVLREEARLRQEIPAHKQYVFTQRGNQTVRQKSARFVRAYHNRLDKQVEKRMRAAIHAVSSIWYTAWVNAGQPPLKTEFKDKWERPDSDSFLIRSYEGTYLPSRKHESNQ